jgi:hypothetical protein
MPVPAAFISHHVVVTACLRCGARLTCASTSSFGSRLDKSWKAASTVALGLPLSTADKLQHQVDNFSTGSMLAQASLRGRMRHDKVTN